MRPESLVLKNTAFLAFGHLLWVALSVALLLLSARILGVEDFGNYSFAFSFVFLFSILSEFGFERIAVRELARFRRKSAQILGNLLALKLLLALFSLALLAVLCVLLGFGGAVFSATLLLGIYVAFNSISMVPKYAFRAFERMHFEALSNVFSKGLTLALGAFALLSGFGLSGLCMSFALSGLAACVFSFALLFHFLKIRPMPLFDFAFWKKTLADGIPSALASFFLVSGGRASAVLLSFMQSSFAVGIYGAAFKIFEGVESLPFLLSLPAYPLLSRAFSKKSGKGLSKAFNNSFRLLILFPLPFAIAASMLSLPLIQLLYGSQYAVSAPVLAILSWSFFLSFASASGINLLFAAGRQKTAAIVSGIGFAALVALNIALIPSMSFEGASISMLFSSLLVFALSLFESQKISRLSSLSFIPKAALAGALMALTIFLLSFAGFFERLAAGFAVYFALIFVFRAFGGNGLGDLKTFSARLFTRGAVKD